MDNHQQDIKKEYLEKSLLHSTWPNLFLPNNFDDSRSNIFIPHDFKDKSEE
ncbi:hypothetical protein [Natroniella sp. ANB-PHB2]|uniref:hypothetical protein n=1 Tax=Natroniella sp. ANB-PHB2 TaxID=3384444 RepID=UPI0038D4BE77